MNLTEEEYAIFRVSKLKSLKAIHNMILVILEMLKAIFRVSKLKSLKAIHNANNN